MKYSAIFLAITRGGVVVTKEVVVDLEEEAFMKHFEAFTKENSARRGANLHVKR